MTQPVRRLINIVCEFARGAESQDLILIEHSVFVAYLAVAGVAFLHGIGMPGIWTSPHPTLTAGNISLML